MDLYTLSDTFLAQDDIDEFVSVIWTERYSSAGDVQLVVPASRENLDKLADGTFLALRGSKEVMTLETQSIENQLLTVIGRTLPAALNQRVAWFKNPDDSTAGNRVVDYTEKLSVPGQFLANVVDKMVIHPVSFGGAWIPADLNWPKEVIPFLTLGAIDVTGTAERQTIPIGPLYDGLAQVATARGVGISLYLDAASQLGYSLKFKTYRGVDHTTGSGHPLIRLTPDMDSISGLKEVRSIQQYKNVCYVYYQGIITKHLAEPTLPEPEGFARRVIVTNPDGDPVGHKETNSDWRYGWTSRVVVGSGDVAAFRAQNAADALANNNYINAIDGQISPVNDYRYGVDYGLGDIIELEGLTGLISKARVTEYIRSQDKTGEKEYPTISVLAG